VKIVEVYGLMINMQKDIFIENMKKEVKQDLINDNPPFKSIIETGYTDIIIETTIKKVVDNIKNGQ